MSIQRTFFIYAFLISASKDINGLFLMNDNVIWYLHWHQGKHQGHHIESCPPALPVKIVSLYGLERVKQHSLLKKVKVRGK